VQNFLVKHRYWVVAIVAIIIIQAVTFQLLNNNKYRMQALHMQKEAQSIIKEIKQSITEKQLATTAIALSISAEVSDIKINDDLKNEKDLQRLIGQIKNFSDYKNLWVQIVDKEGRSVYRSWHPTRDALKKIRPEFEVVANRLEPVHGISSGKFDLTIKVVAPIIADGQLQGYLDMISHFNSIQHSLKELGIDSIVVATKERSKLITKPFSRNFLGDFYIANLKPNEAFFASLTEAKIEEWTSNKRDYWFSGDKLMVRYPLNTITGETHGYLFASAELADIVFETDEVSYLRAENIIFLAIDFVLVVFLLMGMALYTNLKQKKYYQDILNYEQEIVLVSNGNLLIDANLQLFKYFPDLRLNEKGCICDYFENQTGYIKKYMGEQLWIDYILEHPKDQHKVLTRASGMTRVFQLRVRKLNSDKKLYVVVLSDITEMENLNQKLLQQSRTDELTQVGNRLSFNEVINREIELAVRNHLPFTVILFDIDHFKRVNDEFGHLVGDEVLHEIAQRIQSVLRASDYLFRVGGEEFAILLALQDLKHAVQLAEKIRKQVANIEFETVGKVTISLGVSQLKAGDQVNILMGRVDEAMYKAKQNGRNQVQAV